MNSRDLHDPATARLLAERIGTLERLKLLTVLTYGDISAVNPGAMTPWRIEQLWQCYRAAHEEFVRELESERIQDVPHDFAPRADFIRGFPTRYLRIHTPAEIDAHVELCKSSRPTGVAVRVERAGGVYRATVVARDMPALFASLAGAISSFGMDILKAEAFSNEKGQILDTFVFADPKRTLELNPEETERMEQTLHEVGRGKLDVDTLLRNRRTPVSARGKRAIPARVNFDSDSCETATLVEIVAEDRPRLLYDLASTLSAAGCNIDVVLIDTQGRKAIDVFYVTFDGEKLTGDMKDVVATRLVAAC
jgi:[protein-PII] uridylyltransferase